MKRRNVFFWPAILVGSMIFFLFGSFIIWSSDDVGKKTEAVYNVTPNKMFEERTPYELEDGVTKAIYDIEDAIIEELYVETEVDSDRDGEFDRVFITVVRPPTENGMKVPVIYWMSPYHESYSKYAEHYTVTGAEGKTFVDSYDFEASYYVPRGYGFIIGQSIGTANSNGCPTSGGIEETLAAKAVIDWLNGRANAFTADGEEVNVEWTTGETGMLGFSYDGTLANAVATTGVEGLKAIVPGGGISSWYDYMGSNGMYIGSGVDEEGSENTFENEAAGLAEYVWNGKSESCLDVFEEMLNQQGSGDYNEFWAERNYLINAENIQAAVLIAHGMNDNVVKSKNFDRLWDSLKANDVPRKMWLSFDEHKSFRSPEWRLIEHRWFDHWLHGIDNGIMEGPIVRIQHNDLWWTEMEDWPNPSATPVTFQLSHEGMLVAGTEAISKDEKQSFQDGEKMLKLSIASSPDISQPNRLIYMTNKLENDIQMSGTPIVTLSASFDGANAILSAVLVDYGIVPEIVTRGWIDPENRNSIENPEQIVPHEQYSFTWEMQPKGHIFKKGHKIGLVILGTDLYFTNKPTSETTISVTPGLSEIILPLVVD